MKLLLLIGPPCSGKTTWAKQFLLENKEDRWVRFNRDDYREMISAGEYCYHKDTEGLIKSIQGFGIKNAMERGFNVIIDNTHCKVSDFDDNSSLCNEEDQFFVKTFNESPEVLWQRNLNRKHRDLIPKAVMNSMCEGYLDVVKYCDLDKYQFPESNSAPRKNSSSIGSFENNKNN